MSMNPKLSDRLYVKGRRGLFVVVSVEDGTAHVIALDGAPRVIKVRLDEIEPEPDMEPGRKKTNRVPYSKSAIAPSSKTRLADRRQ